MEVAAVAAPLIVWALMCVRLAALTGERVGLNRVGTPANPPAGALVAYGGGAVVLWGGAWALGPPAWQSAALLPGLVYGLSFLLYAWALALGPLSVVAPWPAAAALLLWLADPAGGVAALASVAAMVAGAVLAAGRGGARHWLPIGIMLASDAALAWGRHLDASMQPGALLSYAASVYTVVALLMAALVWVGGGGALVRRQLARQPGWSAVAALSNGAAYVTLVALLRHWPPYLIEALSGAAGVMTGAVGVWWLREADAGRRLAGAALVGAAAAGLVALTLHPVAAAHGSAAQGAPAPWPRPAAAASFR